MMKLKDWSIVFALVLGVVLACVAIGWWQASTERAGSVQPEPTANLPALPA